MGKLVKGIGIAFLLLVGLIAGLAVFVNYYLTDEKVKELVIPQAEAALGRDVSIGDISIGLFSGITIKDFLIKETDGSTDFVNTRAFVLSYDLLPLLQKKLVISEIRLDEPTVRVSRDKKGQFNYASLAILSAGTEKKKSAPPKPAAALPLALAFDQITLKGARVSVRDQLGEIPALDATSNASFSVALGRTIEDMQYSGSFDFDAEVAHGDARTKLNGKGTVNRNDMSVVLDTSLEGEAVHAEASVKSYRKAPDATIQISSKSLNIDKLLAIAAGLPQKKDTPPKKTGPSPGGSGDVIADSLPKGLVARGSVKVDQALYKNLAARDFSLTFDLAEGILTVRELSAGAYGGRLQSSMVVDMNRPGLAYNGELGLQSMQAGDFSGALVKKLAGILSGSLQSSMTFSGAGTTWQQISKALNADGSFKLSQGGIKGAAVTASVATLLGLQELNNITYKDMSGTFTIVEGGKVKLKTKMQGDDLDVEAEGTIGMDGSLNMPLTLHLSQALADRLRSKASFAKYLTGEDGDSTLRLKLAGTLQSPKPALDMQGVQEQLQKSVQKELLKQLNGSGGDSGEKASPEKIIKGLFGK